MDQQLMEHFGNWWAVVIWIALFGVMVAFIPFYKKVQRKPATVYIAFVAAFALEMFGIPLTAYAFSWALGIWLPEGVLWGHTLFGLVGYAGLYIAIGCFLVGMALIVAGWSRIYREYWKRESGSGHLVTGGIYRYIRHPQYTGFLLITLGMIAEWATLPLLVMWPVMVAIYVRLARREEREIEAEFGDAYRRYRANTGMFLPKIAR